MASWNVYNIIGDAPPFLEHEFESRPDWEWADQINPTPDVGVAFKTIHTALSEKKQKWTDELFELLAENGGGRIIRYQCSSSAGYIKGFDTQVADTGSVECQQRWGGKFISVYRADEETLYNRADHDSWDDELTIKGVPFSTRNIQGGEDPKPRFHDPLLKVVQDETGLETAYVGQWGEEWQITGELPDCVYETVAIPEEAEKLR